MRENVTHDTYVELQANGLKAEDREGRRENDGSHRLSLPPPVFFLHHDVQKGSEMGMRGFGIEWSGGVIESED